MFEFGIKLFFQLLQLGYRKLRYINCDLLEIQTTNRSNNLLWPEPGCPCFVVIVRRTELSVPSIDVVFGMEGFGGAAVWGAATRAYALLSSFSKH